MEFEKSIKGAESAWKGFSSQTLYIAKRIVNDNKEYDYYPEDLEDLVIRNGNSVVEAVQVKNISEDLTLSSLASTRQSKSGEGFFNRILRLHSENSELEEIKVVYFNELGKEIKELIEKNKRESLKKKLINNHNICEIDADWILSALKFEKVSLEELEEKLLAQLSEYVETMVSPDLSKILIINKVSELSKNRKSINLSSWRKEIHEIGKNISILDGYYKEYGKSLVRLSDLDLKKSKEQLIQEFKQGIKVHPSHIRENIDIIRQDWLNKLNENIKEQKTIIIKGVSGQGKSTLCYRYLLDKYDENLVFCIRNIESDNQALNLVTSLQGIAKYTDDMIIYLDIDTSMMNWTSFLSEAQSRGLNTPVLISIRDEDFNLSQTSNLNLRFQVIELELDKIEAKKIYLKYLDNNQVHNFLNFEDIWKKFGESGPLIEFYYFLTNNENLKDRLENQINRILNEKLPDKWLSILYLVSYAGRLGIPVYIEKLVEETKCENVISAIKRFSEEYLLRKSEDEEYLEVLHPIRGKLLCEVLEKYNFTKKEKIIVDLIKVISEDYTFLILVDFFTNNKLTEKMILELKRIEYTNWLSYGQTLRAMIWLDIKEYVDNNLDSFTKMKENNDIWEMYIPHDISGLYAPNKNRIDILKSIIPEENRKKFNNQYDFIEFDYRNTTNFITGKYCPIKTIPTKDLEWSYLGYSLFWLKKLNKTIKLDINFEDVKQIDFNVNLQYLADAVRGLMEQNQNIEFYQKLKERIIFLINKKFCIINFKEISDEIICEFIPYILENQNHENHYWRLKVYNILRQMYSNKKYISIKLIGKETLLESYGIESIDTELKIENEKQIDPWLVELNIYAMSRIKNLYRLDNWSEFIQEINTEIKKIDYLTAKFITYINYIYVNGFLNENQINELQELLRIAEEYNLKKVSLPKCAFNKYCLFTEENTVDIEIKLNEVKVELETIIYNEFISSLSRMKTSYVNAIRFLIQILQNRVQNKSIEEHKKNLLVINLSDCFKYFIFLKSEYQNLFSDYMQGIDNLFKNMEINLLNFITICNCVTKIKINKKSILKYAAEKRRLSYKYVDKKLKKLKKEREVFLIEKVLYIIEQIDLRENNDIEIIKSKIKEKIFDEFKLLEDYGSEKALFDKEIKKIIMYIVTKDKIVIDIKEVDIFSKKEYLYTEEIPAELKEYTIPEKKQWQVNIAGNLFKLNFLLSLHNEAMRHKIDGAQIFLGLEEYKKEIFNLISKTIKQLINDLNENSDEIIYKYKTNEIINEVVDEIALEIREINLENIQKYILDETEILQEKESIKRLIELSEYYIQYDY